jgi:hypothetical protein
MSSNELHAFGHLRVSGPLVGVGKTRPPRCIRIQTRNALGNLFRQTDLSELKLSRNQKQGHRCQLSMKGWPFDDSPNVAVITTRQVTEDNAPILLVSHDEEDGGWQFLPGGPVLEENARVVALRRIWLLDPSVGQLADLPLGWQASRKSPLDPWRCAPRRN